jgi:hypothetical protein
MNTLNRTHIDIILWHRSRKNSTSPATPTATMAGSATALASYYYPTAMSWGYPHLEVLIPSSNQTESSYHKYRGLGTSSTEWNPTDGSLALIGGKSAPFSTSIAAVSLYSGSLDIFITGGNDNTVYHKWHTNNATWSPDGIDSWEPRSQFSAGTAPAAVSWGPDRMDVFVLSAAASDLYQQGWDSTNGWYDWYRLGGNWTNYVPTVVSWGQNRLDAFVVDPKTNEMYHHGVDT